MAFDKEYHDSKAQHTEQNFHLKLLFKIIKQEIKHKPPLSIFTAAIHGEMHYEFISPKGEVIITGSTIGEAMASRLGYTWGFINTGNWPLHSVSRKNLKAAFSEAINEACMKIVNELRTRQEIVAVVRKVQEKRSLPADLAVKLKYCDEFSLIPNNMIDPVEKSDINVSITNNGKGTAFDVILHIESDCKDVHFPKTITIGDIQPGKSKEVKVNLEANADLPDCTAPFWLLCKESRGYDSKKYNLNVQAVKLVKPRVAIINYKINDGASGFANGNGNGVPENGETIEIIPFIRNDGPGQAIQVNLRIASVSGGIEIKRGNANIPQIQPGQTVTEHLAFFIPPSFLSKEIDLNLVASDVRGVSTTNKLFTLNTIIRRPVLGLGKK